MDSTFKSHELLLNEAFEFIIKHIYPRFIHHYIKDLDYPVNLNYEDISKACKLSKYKVRSQLFYTEYSKSSFTSKQINLKF